MDNRSIENRTNLLHDEQLFRIANCVEEDGYETAAIDAAKAEIDRRNLSAEVIADLKSEATVERVHEESRSHEPLSVSGWIGFGLFGGILVISILVIYSLFSQGYTRKCHEAIYAIFAGLAFFGFILMFLFAMFA